MPEPLLESNDQMTAIAIAQPKLLMDGSDMKNAS